MDTADVQVMAARWVASAGDLSGTAAPATLGLSWQPSATAVNAAHAEVTAFTAALTARVDVCCTHVTEADTRYLANEASSAHQLAAVANPVTSV